MVNWKVRKASHFPTPTITAAGQIFSLSRYTENPLARKIKQATAYAQNMTEFIRMSTLLLIDFHPWSLSEIVMSVLRVRSRSRSFRPFNLLVAILVLYCSAAVGRAQSTTVTISNTVETPGIDRPGINLGGIGGYGSQQLLKSLNYVNGGYFPGTYAATTYACNGGTTTTWYNSIASAGYPANFWAGATFVAINAATGTSYGSGTVTASTSNTGSAGITFSLSPAISSPCNPSQNDVLMVRLTELNTLISPYQLLNNHICAGATWDTTDTSPSSTNTLQSLEMPSGCVLTFYLDATLGNRTNTNSALASQQVNFINLNGSYNATFKAKCASAGCSINFNFGRLGGTTFVGSTTVNPPYSATPGAGWTTYNYPFTASETGSQDQSLGYAFSCTGTCLLQDADVIEGSTLAGNNTVFRDAVVSELQKLHPGSIRYMDASQWCSDVADEIATTGNRRWCGSSDYGPGVGQPLGYNDVLALANFIGSDVLISVGALNQPPDWAELINWLSSSGWISTYASSGHTIYLEDGNEAWNPGASATLYFGNGTSYGYTLGLNMAAARAAAGYNPSVIKLVGDSWTAGEQGYGQFGWIHNVLTVAQATPNGLPDFVDDAPYTLNYLGYFETSGNNVASTGAPFLDEWAEDTNIDSVTSPPLYTQSMYLNHQYAKQNFGVNTLVYEVNQSTLSGVAATQLQLDQIGASVGNALSIAQHVLLMQRDSGVTGPIHVFTLAEPYTGYTCNGSGCVGGVVMPLWGTNLFMATGPEQAVGTANADRPLAIALEIINNAIGSNNDLMSIKQTGTPTFNYPGGQVQSGSNSISPNSAVPYVNCFSYSNGAAAWTTICFNNNLTTAESVTLAGAGAPTGLVSETVFPGPSNLITDHNENTYLGVGSVAPAVTTPSATSTSGTSYSIPPASMMVLAYTNGGTPTLAAPNFSQDTGTYSTVLTVTISLPAGSTGCAGINTMPTAPTAGTCGPGGTVYTGPITVSTSETVNVIATEAGFTNSATTTEAYTINLVLPAPTFSPGAGSYTTAQTVTISDATGGTTIYYTTNGTTPTTSSSVYSGPVTVSSSESLEAIAVETGHTTSSPGTAAYKIVPLLPPPTFSPAGGTYATAQTVTIGDATGGTTIYYTTNGTTPTTSSSVYSGPVAVSASGTLQAIALETGYTTSVTGSATYTISSTVSVSTSCYQGSAASSFTMGPINTTGANEIAIAVASFNVISSVTDNMGNGYAIGLTAESGGSPNNQIFYWNTPTVGSGHNFTVNGNSGLYASACVFVMYGVTGGYSGAQNANSVGYSSATCQGGSITPGSGQQVVVAGFGTYAPTGVPTLDSSYTVGAYQAGAAGSAFGEAAGYIIQPSGTATNPKWNWGNSATTPGCVIAAFSGGPGVPTAAIPTFTPAAGTYASSQTVSISDATPGTTIYYTTNGTTPATSSSVYSGPITVSASETIEAIAAETGYTTSAAGLAAYTISPVLPTPTFTPAAGTYASSQTVTIGDATSGTTIYYTTNGTTPTASSSVYSGPITVSASETIEAIAVETGYTSSTAAMAAYTIASATGFPPAVSASCFQGSSSSSLTIGPINTIGATAIAIVVGSLNDISSVTDNMGNGNAIGLTAASGGSPNNQIFYWQTPNVGSGHTFAVNGSSGLYGSACVLVMSGITGTYSGVHSANSAGYGSASCQAGSITPANGPQIVITGFGVYTPTGTPTLDSSYTVGAYQAGTAGSAYGEAAGYIIQPSGATTNPNWNWGNNASSPSCVIAAFGGGTGVPIAATPTFTPGTGSYTSSQTVTISDATAGTTIYYTTNGTTPTASSTAYSSPITVSASETLEAIAVETGCTNSPAATAAYTINPVLPAPSFSPAAGTYTTSQSITISDATAGTTIYYTTNGTMPTTSSSVYSGPITVSASETLQAIAVQTGYATSAAASAAYTINLPAATPTFSPAAGTYSSAQTVTISSTTPPATIYYTTNGSTPTTSSAVYSGPITVSSTETLQAIAVATGYSTSAAGSAAYTISSGATGGSPSLINPVCFSGSAATTFTTGPVNTTGATAIVLSVVWFQSLGNLTSVSDNEGNSYMALTAYPSSGGNPAMQFYYVLNPTVGSAQTFSIAGSGGLYPTVCVAPIAGISGVVYDGDVVGSTGGYGQATCQPGSINPGTGTHILVTGSSVYAPTGPASINDSFTVAASAPGAGGSSFGGAIASLLQSPGAAVDPTWTWASSATTPSCAIASFSGAGGAAPTVATPAFSPAAGTYAASQSVTISDATAGTTIYYTTNGTTPTTSSSVYSSPITFSASETLEAIAVETGYTNSAAATAAYTINSILPAPSFSPAAGTYATSQSVTIGDATAGTTLYYTTNGTTPTTSSSVYSSPITFSASETLEAIAVETGYINSAAATAAYTINGTASAQTLTVNALGCKAASGGTTTFGPFNGVGYTEIVVGMAAGSSGIITDSTGGNTYSKLTLYTYAQLAYARLTDASSSMTVSVSNGPALCVWLIGGINGNLDSGSDRGAANSGSNCSPGSYTPGSGSHVIVTMIGGSGPTTASASISNTGTGAYTVGTPIIAFSPGATYGAAEGHLIQSSGTKSNLTWAETLSGSTYCAEASFN
jgi:hypothetical protein